ncbi:MAG: Ig-like domain-containing protein [Candidatus Scalinduaceae bacterium]
MYADNPPEAIDDFATTTKNTPVTIDVAANDTDQDGNLDPTTVVVSAPPSNGTAISNGDGTITYTPDTSFTGI